MTSGVIVPFNAVGPHVKSVFLPLGTGAMGGVQRIVAAPPRSIGLPLNLAAAKQESTKAAAPAAILLTCTKSRRVKSPTSSCNSGDEDSFSGCCTGDLLKRIQAPFGPPIAKHLSISKQPMRQRPRSKIFIRISREAPFISKVEEMDALMAVGFRNCRLFAEKDPMPHLRNLFSQHNPGARTVPSRPRSPDF